MSIVKKKKNEPVSDIGFDSLKFYRVPDSSKIYDYAEDIMHRVPIVINLSECTIPEANEVLLFLTGVLYACDGEIVKIQDRIYLLAQKNDLNGPTLKRFISEYSSKK